VTEQHGPTVLLGHVVFQPTLIQMDRAVIRMDGSDHALGLSVRQVAVGQGHFAATVVVARPIGFHVLAYGHVTKGNVVKDK
jgi:hypothetical protein